LGRGGVEKSLAEGPIFWGWKGPGGGGDGRDVDAEREKVRGSVGGEDKGPRTL